MNYKEILIFDISSEYGHFRKFNTTTSPLTYSIPTRTAVVGIIGAILGLEREISEGKYKEGTEPIQEKFSKKNADIAIQILNPVKKVNIGFNLLNTKESFFNIKNRTQIEFELLKDAKFRIYFAMSNKEVFNELSDKVKKHKYHFSPYLGLSQFTLVADFVDIVKAEISENYSDEYIKINSVVNLSKTYGENPIQFDNSAKYASNIMPIEMDKNRIIQEFSDVLIERDGDDGKYINAMVKEYCKLGKYGNVLFL